MKIERVTKQLAPQASHIFAMSWKTGYRGIVPQAYLDSIPDDRWVKFLGNEGYENFREDWMLCDDDRYVAVSSVCHARDAQYDGWGELMSIYVMPDAYRHGYGRVLFSFAMERLRAQGYRDAYLWVLEDNLRARCFYEAMGFRACGDRIFQNIGGCELAELRYVGKTLNTEGGKTL